MAARWRMWAVIMAAVAASVMAASKQTSKTGTSPLQSSHEFQEEMRYKFNLAVDDIDSLYTLTTGTGDVSGDSIAARTIIVSDSGYIDTLTSAKAAVTKLYVTGDSLKVTGLISADTLAGAAITIPGLLNIDTLQGATVTITGQLNVDTVAGAGLTIGGLIDVDTLSHDTVTVTGILAIDTTTGNMTVSDSLAVGGAITCDTLLGDLVSTGSVAADSVGIGAGVFVTKVDTVGSNDTLLIILSTGDSLIIATDR